MAQDASKTHSVLSVKNQLDNIALLEQMKNDNRGIQHKNVSPQKLIK